MKLLLTITFCMMLLVACNHKTIDAIQTKEVMVRYIKTLTVQRMTDGKYNPVTFYIYEDEHKTQYRVKTYEGLIMKIHITSRSNL